MNHTEAVMRGRLGNDFAIGLLCKALTTALDAIGRHAWLTDLIRLDTPPREAPMAFDEFMRN